MLEMALTGTTGKPELRLKSGCDRAALPRRPDLKAEGTMTVIVPMPVGRQSLTS